MFKKKLELAFISIILIAISILGYNYYKNYSFKNNDIPDSYNESSHQNSSQTTQGRLTKHINK